MPGVQPATSRSPRRAAPRLRGRRAADSGGRCKAWSEEDRWEQTRATGGLTRESGPGRRAASGAVACAGVARGERAEKAYWSVAVSVRHCSEQFYGVPTRTHCQAALVPGGAGASAPSPPRQPSLVESADAALARVSLRIRGADVELG
eukprot:187912-Chlamydomonas_euryale.AAC.5